MFFSSVTDIRVNLLDPCTSYGSKQKMKINFRIGLAINIVFEFGFVLLELCEGQTDRRTDMIFFADSASLGID